jgi:hypothetical protein
MQVNVTLTWSELYQAIVEYVEAHSDVLSKGDFSVLEISILNEVGEDVGIVKAIATLEGNGQ